MMKASKTRISALFGLCRFSPFFFCLWRTQEGLRAGQDGQGGRRNQGTQRGHDDSGDIKEDPNLTVELTEATRVGQVQGRVEERAQKSMSMAALYSGTSGEGGGISQSAEAAGGHLGEVQRERSRASSGDPGRHA